MAALWVGLNLPNDMGFWISVTAALALVGPGLVFSNVLIGRWQRRRIEQQALPWLVSACAFLAQSFETFREIATAAGVERQLPPTPPKCDVEALTATAIAYQKAFTEALESAQPLPTEIYLTRNNLTLTHFGLVARMLDKASSLVPVSVSSQIATVSDAWAQSAGVTIVHCNRDDGRGPIDRKIGYPHIVDAARSAEVSPSTLTHFDTQSLSELALNQVHRTASLFKLIEDELPPDLKKSLRTFDLPQLTLSDS
ncbi:hypothetical protein RBB84_19395 [Rhodococcus sp. D-6]|uniref:Uncharacterized protein n=1 Tax=Rhodococcus sp. D-6 TaxID=1387842 RepID=A0AAU7UVH8_9NOCA